MKNTNNDQKSSVYIGDALTALVLPVSMMYMEILAKLKIFGSVFDDTFVYMSVFALGTGFLLSFVAMLLGSRPRRIFIGTVLALLAVWFSFHVSYQQNFQTFFSWQSIGQAKDVTQFWREAIAAARGVWYVIVGFFVPFIVMCALGIQLAPDGRKRNVPFAVVSLASFAALFLPMISYINGTKDKNNGFTPYYFYTYLQNDLDSSYRYYGIINTSRIDFGQLIFGAPVEKIDVIPPENDTSVASPTDTEPEPPEEYGWNAMEIDFEKAEASTKSEQLKAMDRYFSGLSPTQKNEYTGIFKGKNLIFITLEGFCDRVIDPEFTPILYKMSTEGFVFTNSYNTVWGGSTASGEYSNLTGNFYLNSSCFKKSSTTYQPFTLANQLAAQGYQCFGYHNNTYQYYARDVSHPNFGYKWVAIGNGLKLKSKAWPNSDKEMAEATVGDYVNLDTPFHAYYMSVSGHANYNFGGNMMSTRHSKDLTEKMKRYPLDVKAYFACQYEAELMLEVLVEELEKAGKLNDTVFAMAADHYPYALSNEGLAKLYKLPKANIRSNFDLYRNQFILWCPSMKEPVRVDNYCSTIDILPTLSNMFGLEYDSRLMMGTDIMAEGEHFALLKVNGWSWVSAQGNYRASIDKFTPSESCTLSKKETEEYVKRMNALVRAKTTYSPLIIELDYYGHVFGKKQ